ncbi:mitochondrial inner membrane protein OXA1L isoform X1 [Rhipicephalus sanguineus]|uniref:mitochondrial inner membrane protein OXA1L isoform X1 n=1 Tax=Rhipicephalus sanguineus TaxID=34632 RepID=UPI0018937A94|nr:mitochondrial inner membrane protein OXA1L isoform X1 [Rhipicephalus sanguineus]
MNTNYPLKYGILIAWTNRPSVWNSLRCQHARLLSVRSCQRMPLFKSNSIKYTSFNCQASRRRWVSSEAGKAQTVAASVGQLEQTSAETVIPAVPPAPTVVPVESFVESLGDDTVVPTLQSVGLGGWSPSGMVQQLLDLLHTSTGLPWWATIAVSTLFVKVLLLPLIIKGQKNSIHMNNNLPQMQHLQAKMTEARNTGNQLEAARLANELMMFMKEKNVNPLKSMIIPLAQAPVFISFFFALRGMANLPMESFKTGGLLWFTDLTVPDPLYILPLITSVSLFCTLELGAESGVRADNLQWTRYVFRCLPVAIFPITMNFPSALLCYWVTSNVFTLCQVGVLRIEAVRKRLDIPALIKHPKSELKLSKKGFVEGVRESFTNTRIAREIEERAKADEVRFKKAGIGPVVKTYTYDPTKQAFAKGAGSSQKING